MPQSGRVRRRWLVKSVNRVGSAALGWRIVVAMIALAALRSPAAGELVGVDLQLVIATCRVIVDWVECGAPRELSRTTLIQELSRPWT